MAPSSYLPARALSHRKQLLLRCRAGYAVAALLLLLASCGWNPNSDSKSVTSSVHSLEELGVPRLQRGSVNAQDPAAWAAIRGWLDQLQAAGAAPSLAVGVAFGGDRVFSHAAGLSDVADEVESTTSTPYQIASLTKLFTAYALMALVEAGAVSLDDPAQRWLPQGTSIGADRTRSSLVTMRHLATHRSGLGDLEFTVHKSAPEEGGSYATVDPNLVYSALSETSLEFEPGEAFRYSNLGYGLLGLILERVTSSSFEEVLQRHVLAPLGLTDTWLIDTDRPAWDTVARRQDGPRDRGEPALRERLPGSGGLVASIDDLTKFAAAVADKRSSQHMSSETKKAMLEAGIGWLPIPSAPGLFHMTGGRAGVSSYVIIEPATSLAVAVVANDSINIHTEIGRELLAALRAAP